MFSSSCLSNQPERERDCPVQVESDKEGRWIRRRVSTNTNQQVVVVVIIIIIITIKSSWWNPRTVSVPTYALSYGENPRATILLQPTKPETRIRRFPSIPHDSCSTRPRCVFFVSRSWWWWLIQRPPQYWASRFRRMIRTRIRGVGAVPHKHSSSVLMLLFGLLFCGRPSCLFKVSCTLANGSRTTRFVACVVLVMVLDPAHSHWSIRGGCGSFRRQQRPLSK